MTCSLQVKTSIITNNLMKKSTALEIPDNKFDDYAAKFVRAFNRSQD